MTDRTKWLEYWYTALHSPLGVVLAVSDVPRAIQKLYQARQQSGDPELSGLSIRKSPLLPDEEVWLVKQQSKVSSDGTQGDSSAGA